EALAALNGVYKGDYRAAFVEKNPDFFLRHIPDDFQSIAVDGSRFDAAALRAVFPQQFRTIVRTLEHHVTIDNLQVGVDGTVSTIVTLYTLIERHGVDERTYFVTTIGTYRDEWQKRGGMWFQVRGDQLHNQVITDSRP
ncbi:MAG: hypothetical protein JOY96_10695, partial [Verrucomicrobia bacterium]|nr:hypothetical protein [Verrucomicrobiota bacterium]